MHVSSFLKFFVAIFITIDKGVAFHCKRRLSNLTCKPDMIHQIDSDYVDG